MSYQTAHKNLCINRKTMLYIYKDMCYSMNVDTIGNAFIIFGGMYYEQRYSKMV